MRQVLLPFLKLNLIDQCREFFLFFTVNSTHHLIFQVFQDAACEREVLNLRVKCPFQSCPWAGELRGVEVRREIRNTSLKGS